MEEARCWMVTNRASRFGDKSWEEKAFAEDAAGMLGGCVWPPRSYSCDFCRREFRSAQALGGHMNVHRRDRARLKQFSSSQHHERRVDPQPNSSYRNQPINSGLCLTTKSPAQKQEDAIIDANPTFVSHPSVVSLHQTAYSSESELVSSFLINHDKDLSSFSLNNDEKTKDLHFKFSKNHEKARIFISMRNSATYEDNKDTPNRYKRRKLDISSPPVINKSDKDVVHVDHTPKVDPPKVKYLDLELRLGDRPKVQDNFP